MPDDYKGVDLLYETPETGRLAVNDQGKAERIKAPEYTGPSLSGPDPFAGSGRGIGGTAVEADQKAKPAAQANRALTPDELMAWANQQEQSYMDQTKQAELAHHSAVEPTLQRTGSVPEWLDQYMSKQPFTDPYHQVPMTPQESIRNNKYLTERERLKLLKDMRSR